MKPQGRPPIIDAAAVRQCQEKGMTQAEAAEHLGISLSGVRANWVKAETHGRPTKGAEISERLANGESVEAVAAALGVSAATVRRHRRAVTGARPYVKKA